MPSTPSRLSYRAEVLGSLPRRGPLRIGRLVVTCIVGLVLVGVAASVVSNSRFDWGTVADNLFATSVLRGVFTTAWIVVLVTILALPFALLIAIARMSAVRIASWSAWAFVWVFRSVPQLVQILFWFNLGALYPQLVLGIPFGPSLAEYDTNRVISSFVAAVFGLALSEVAYISEMMRGAILSIDRGQRDAARALGMPPATVMFRIVLPQATRVAIPPLAGEIINLVKGTSLVSVISMTDLLYSTQLIYQQNYRPIPLLIVASIWYLAITSVLSVAQHHLERHFGKGYRSHHLGTDDKGSRERGRWLPMMRGGRNG